MSDAIEVLKKYSTSCSVCKYDGGNQCKASGGEFGECKTAEELSKAINEALLALEQKDVKDTEIKLLHKQITDYERILNGLNEWLEKEIRKCYSKNFYFKDWTPVMDTVQKQVRHDTLKEVCGAIPLNVIEVGFQYAYSSRSRKIVIL